MRVAIGLVGAPDGAAVAGITDHRLHLLAALMPLAGAGPALPTLPALLEAGEGEVDRIEKAVGWAESSGIEPVVDGRPVWFERSDGPGSPGAPRLLAPITLANKVHCLGDIFLSHLAVGGGAVPDRVGVFTKLTQDVIGPWQPIVRPRVHTGNVVGGTELTMVIGQRGRYWTPSEAKAAIWGYTVLNDVTLRGLHPQLGPTLKAWETSAPLGPYLVPRRHIPDPHAVGLRMRLDGRQIQDGNTRDMRFDLFESLAEISNWHTMRPGDVIATGDIGSRDDLPPGSVVECDVEGVAVLANPVVIGEGPSA